MLLLNSFRSEWLKTKRSAASWLCLTGGFFLPLLYLIGSLKDHHTINALGDNANIWEQYYFHICRFMAIALLPMGVILASSLITQVEYRNNTWKQVHTSPQPYTTLFFAKLGVILMMTLKFFLFFNIGILLSATLPSLMLDHHLPRQSLPAFLLLKINAKLFVTCLPFIAGQFLLGLLFRNFLVPVGIGLLLWIGSIILIQSWQYAYLSPYSYSSLLFMGNPLWLGHINIQWLSFTYFLALLAAAYVLYLRLKDKG